MLCEAGKEETLARLRKINQLKKLGLSLDEIRDVKKRVQPLLKARGEQDIFDFGEGVGAATLAKLIGNFLIVSAGHSLREALFVDMLLDLLP